MDRLLCSACLAALLLPESSFAQSDEPVLLPTIFLSVDRGLETTIDDTTTSVTVISAEDIANQSDINTTVGDVLANTVPGFAVGAENLTEYGQPLRGRNFLTLIDGVPQTNTLNNDFRALNGISANAVEQIEVVRGANAAYGFGGAGGLVNIITKDSEVEEYTRLTYGVSAQPTNVSDSAAVSLALTTSQQLGDFDLFASLSAEQTGSSFTSDGSLRPPDSYGTQGGLDDVTALNGTIKLGYSPTATSRVEFSANIYDYTQDSDYEGAVSGGDLSESISATPTFGQVNTVTPGTQNETYSLNYTEDEFFGGALDVLLYHNERTNTFTRTYFSLFDYTYPQYETESAKTGARVTITSPISDALTLAYGLDVIHDETTVTEIDGPTGTPDLTQTGYAPFLQATYEAANSLRVTGGIRYEILDIDVNDFTNEQGTAVDGGSIEYTEPLFNLSASYDLTNDLSVYGGYAQTFQIGSLARALADGTIASVDAASAEGQRTDSYEIGLRGNYGAFDFNTALFYSESTAGETYDADLNLVLAPEEIYGLEFAANYDIAPEWRVGGTLTLIEGRYDTDGDGAVDADLGSDRITPTKLTAYLQYTPNDDMMFRLDGLYSGSRNPDSDQFTGLQSIDDYVVFDASARFKVGMGELSVGIDNVFNADYAPVLQQSYSVEAYGYDDYYYVEGAGRTISTAYTIEF